MAGAADMLARFSLAHDQRDDVGAAREDDAIGDGEDGWRVEDDVVVALAGPQQQALHRLGTEQLGGEGGYRTAAKVLRPMRPLRPKRGCTLGRRRSPSISSTRVSPWASTQAMLLAMVVLPSDAVELVKRMYFGGLPLVESNSEVRSERSDSANCDSGEVRTAMLRCAVAWRSFCSALLRLIRGTMASDGSWVTASVSAMLRSPVPRLASRNATMMTMIPIRLPRTSMVKTIVLLGCRVGAAGGTGSWENSSPK
jgi:hypothetical protein